MRRIHRLASVLFLLVLSFSPVLATGDENRNVLAKVTVIQQDGDGHTTEREYELLTGDGQRTQLISGIRKSFFSSGPATAGEEKASQPEAQSFTYQNLGITIQVEARILDDGRVKAAGRVELSDVDRQGGTDGGGAPNVVTFQQNLGATLIVGRPETISKTSRFDGGTIEIVLECRIAE